MSLNLIYVRNDTSKAHIKVRVFLRNELVENPLPSFNIEKSIKGQGIFLLDLSCTSNTGMKTANKLKEGIYMFTYICIMHMYLNVYIDSEKTLL